MAERDATAGAGESFSMDAWDGYKVSRDKLLDFIATRQIANPLVITGDVHQNWANNLLRDFSNDNSQILGSEFVGTSISTTGDGGDGSNAGAMTENPWIKYNSQRRGYVRVSLTQEPGAGGLPDAALRQAPGRADLHPPVVRRRGGQPRPEGRMMKIILSLAALAAVMIAFQNANAVEEPPEPRVQLVEVEQQTPYLESFNSITAGTATQSAIRRAGNTGGVVFSSQAYALFDNQNPDGSRATFPLEVEDADTYGLRAQFVKGPDMGVVQVAVDGRPLGAPIDLYAAALQRARPVALGVLALSEGKHMFTLTVTEQERGVEQLPGRHRPADPRHAGRAAGRRRPRWRPPRSAARSRRRSR